MQCRPQVDDVALLIAAAVKALKDILVEMDAEGPASAVAAVQRAGTAPLRSAALESRRQTELIEHPADRELAFEMGEVEVGALADRFRFGYPVGTGRGDRCPSRLCRPLVARGLVCL